MSTDTFQDFCQAWTSRFPNSELPEAWEEDVRNNLSKHRNRVVQLREELEKEEMYVDYLHKLLKDIELHRSKLKDDENNQADNGQPDSIKSEDTVPIECMKEGSRLQFLEDQCERHTQANLRSSLHLDLENGEEAKPRKNPFVTVINVKSPNGLNRASSQELPIGSKFTFTRRSMEDGGGYGRTASQVHGSEESLNSVSSPISSSPRENIVLDNLMSPREAPASPREDNGFDLAEAEPIIQKSSKNKPEPPERTVSVREETTDSKSLSSTEDLHSIQSRGRPDGGEGDEVTPPASSASTPFIGATKTASRLKELKLSKPPIATKPEKVRDGTYTRSDSVDSGEGRKESRRKSSLKSQELLSAGLHRRESTNSDGSSVNRNNSIKSERTDPGSVNRNEEDIPSPLLARRSSNKSRKDSDSSRGRMGSPSGKSHDSSDGESWGHLNQTTEASSLGRLDRLVRKPSVDDSESSRSERGSKKGPPLPKPRKISRASKSGEKSVAEPLYDQVCNDDPEDQYDNHLLYGTNSLDLSLDESKLGVSGGTLSSSTDTAFSGSPSLVKKVTQMEEEETNYVNIQYFLQQTRSSQFDRQESKDFDMSDDEEASYRSGKSDSKSSLDGKSSLESSRSSTNTETDKERLKMQTHILHSILDSEAIYLECLSVCLQYMKAMKVTLSTPSPLIPKEDFDVIFYKIPELYEFHHHFHENLKKQVERWTGEDKIGHHFKMLAQQTKVYAQFLSNYPKALDTLHRCSQTHQQFADLTASIKLRTLKGQQQGQSVSLEDLLHKPVARVQKNSMSLQDLIKFTPENSSDFANLSESLRLIQNFLNEYNLEHRSELYPHQERSSRHLVKNSFIIELSEGVRKLRHLFLFNDVLVCAKYKATNKGEKFTFQLKWYIPLSEALIVEDPSVEPRETKPANIVALKTGAAALRDQIYQAQREDEWRGKSRGKVNLDKPRKQLAEYEAQLVLASPHLIFQVSSKSGKTYSFYLSSEFERSQWVETLKTLQSNLPPNTSQAHTLSMVELQSWISSCRKFLKTNMGSFLMRSARDEPLLIGDLGLVIKSMSGLTRTCNLYIVAEIDSYGHYFRKVRTRTVGGSMEPVWNEEFTLELEGSENLRLLVYQDGGKDSHVLRGKACMELSRSWLSAESTQQRISIGDLILTCEMKFTGYEQTVRRVPQSKPTALFKTPLHLTTRKEKRAIPFIVTSCVREVERRGITEVGIYRVSGSSADMSRLRKAYESNAYEAEQLLKECDIHAVAGILKQYLRDLPECIFSSNSYLKLFQAYSIPDEQNRCRTYLQLFSQLPQNPNQACVVFLIEHLVRVTQLESQNKMSLHNMATVFGPTMLHAGQERDKKGGDILATSTVDVMAQSGILHFFLSRRANGEPIQISDRTL